MMSPISAIAPVEVLSQAVAKAVVAPTPAEHLAQKFDAMMKATPPLESAAQMKPHQSHEFTQAVSRQEGLVRDTFDKIDDLQRHAGDMSTRELLAQSLGLSRDLTLANFAISSATAVAQGANKSLQSLLKNQ
jgi:type III secretion system HrpB2-like protein